MANFRPLKKYLLLLIDDLIVKYSLNPPFLDAGCGTGDISLHLARKGWGGDAIDISAETVSQARNTLRHHKGIVNVSISDLNHLSGRYKTIFLCDVLEHLENDNQALASLEKALEDDGALVVSVPVFKNEWRWDDDYYGHIRRYEIREIQQLLERNKFHVEVVWDFTFPVFWLIRRAYTKIVPRKLIINDKTTQTRNSARQSAWDRGIATSLFEYLIWWKPVFWLQTKFRGRLYGCECILLARREVNGSQ